MPPNIPSQILWQSPVNESIAARIAIAGDFLPGGHLEVPHQRTWKDMARLLAPLVHDVDIGIANLETVLDPQGLAPRPLIGLGDIVASPREALEYLSALRFRFLSLANNHSLDFGASGLARTRAAAAAHCLTPLGAGRTLRDAPEFSIWQGPGNLRVGFWAAAKATHDPSTRNFAGVEPATPARAREAMALLRSQRAQFCIALLHAGCLRTSHPDPEDVHLLDAIASEGFDVVAASHSHRVSGSRLNSSSAKPFFCFYGLGSLISGYVSSPLEAEGLIVVAGLTAAGNLQRLEIRPVVITSSRWGVVPATSDAASILARFNSLSRQIADGSYRLDFYRDISRGMFGVYWRDARAAFRNSGLAGLMRKAGRVRLRHFKRVVRAVAG